MLIAEVRASGKSQKKREKERRLKFLGAKMKRMGDDEVDDGNDNGTPDEGEGEEEDEDEEEEKEE